MSRIGIVTSTILLGLGYTLFLEDYWQLVFAIVGLGVVWFIGEGKGWRGLPEAGLIIFIGLAALGLYLEKPAFLMLLGSIVALVTWDLSLFARRLAQAEWIENDVTVRRTHWQRLAMTAGLGLLLSGLALGVAIPMSFGVAIILGLLAVVGLSWVVGSIKQSQ